MAALTHSLPALRTKPKAIFFTDFDGTITLQDSNDWMTDNLGFGAELRRQGNKDVLYSGRPFRDAFQEMLDSVTKPFDQCLELLLKNVKLDPAFKEFASWVCIAFIYRLRTLLHCRPVTILSLFSGVDFAYAAQSCHERNQRIDGTDGFYNSAEPTMCPLSYLVVACNP